MPIAVYHIKVVIKNILEIQFFVEFEAILQHLCNIHISEDKCLQILIVAHHIFTTCPIHLFE